MNVKKFTAKQIGGILKHIERTYDNPSNQDIDMEKIHLDYSLVGDRGKSSYDYYKERLSQCYVYGRADVNVAFSWVITLPKDVPAQKADLFFHHMFNFLTERYGGLQNVLQCAVHYSETTPHMHFVAMPIVANNKITKKRPQAEKLDCASVINRQDLRNIHLDAERALKSKGFSPCSIYTGITAKQGGNRSIRELKVEREIQREHIHEIERRW